MGCPYANILGIPGQGFHARRIFGYALNDTLATIALALVTSYLMRTPFLATFIAWFVIGEVSHYLFGSQTAFLTTIGVKACPA